MNRKIHIAYLIDTISSDKAGTEKQLFNIIGRINNNLFEVTVVCLHESPWMVNNRLPCKMINLGYKGFLKLGFPSVLRQYTQLITEMRFDIVQTFFEDAMFVGYFGRLLSRTSHALIISRRDLGLGSDEPAYHRFFKKIKPFILRLSDGVVANANAIKEHIVKNENVSPKNITVICNGLDVPTHPKELPLLFREHQSDIWIGIVANLKPVKRLDLLLRALAHLKEGGTKEKVRVVILGEGKLKSELLQLAADIGISDLVHFVGAVENVSDYLCGVDIGVLCSDTEGLSNAILEYMACGLPVVATNAGGNSELVDDKNGACVPVGDHFALALELLKLITSPSLRKKKGRCSLNKVSQKFTWDRIIPQWEGYYCSLSKVPVFYSNLMENADDKA